MGHSVISISCTLVREANRSGVGARAPFLTVPLLLLLLLLLLWRGREAERLGEEIDVGLKVGTPKLIIKFEHNLSHLKN